MSTNMTAVILVDKITSPTTLIFASIFFTLSIVCVIGNVLALIVVSRTKNRTFSTKQSATWNLFNLALSGVFIGMFWCTVCGVQLLTDTLRMSPILEITRRFLGISLPGNFMSLIVCISYDRYILLRHSKNHNKFMSKRKTVLMIAASWITYLLMVKLVRDSEKKFIVNNITSMPTHNRQLNKTIKLTKTASMLLLSFLVCHLPIALLLLVRINCATCLSSHTQQIILLFTESISQVTACLSPGIYFMTCDVYLRELKKLLKNNKSPRVEMPTPVAY